MEIESGRRILKQEGKFKVMQMRLPIKTNEALITLQEARSFSKMLIRKWAREDLNS